MKFTALIATLLLAAPALAEGQYEFSKVPPECQIEGLATAEKNWTEDPEETQRILSTQGLVTRNKSTLVIGGSRQSFADQTPDTCAESFVEAYKFEAIVGNFAIVRGTFYEDVTSYLVNLQTGAKVAIEAFQPAVSPSGRYIVFQHPGFPDFGPPILLIDLADPLRSATLDAGDFYADGGSFVWMDDTRLRVQLITYTDVQDDGNHPENAGVTDIIITPSAIKLQIEKTGEVLTAPFEPVSP